MIGGIYLDMLDLACFELKTVLWFHVAVAAPSIFSFLGISVILLDLAVDDAHIVLLVDVIEFRLKSTADRFNITLQY